MTRLDRMRKEYETYTKADSYYIGFPMGEDVFAVKMNKIPRRFTRVQKESKSNGGGYGLYINVRTKKAKNELIKKAVRVCSLAELESGEYNKGVMFEKAIYEMHGQTFRGKDSVPFHKGGDINVDGEEIQVKYLHARICYDRTLKNLKKAS